MFYQSNTFRLFSIISTQSINCSLFIIKGGAKRILSPCVGFASNPFSFNSRQSFHAASLSVCFISMALNHPLPRISVMCDDLIFCNSCLKIFPSASEFSAIFSSCRTFNAVMATLDARGLPP